MLFDPIRVGPLELPNRIIMAPMTRNRAGQPGDVPTPVMARYYAQRASSGLIISEGTPVSTQALGYLYTPGMFSSAQLEGWRAVTEAVHNAGGRIFAQLWHCGRVSHHSLQPKGHAPVAPSESQAQAQVFAYDDHGNPGLVPVSPAQALSEAGIHAIIEDFRQAAANARSAGFDGVEIHGANGYLLDQFLNAGVNRRQDAWGGSLENRARFTLAVVTAAAEAIGPDRVGLRLSPHGSFNDMADDPDADAQTRYIAAEAGRAGLAYLHFVDPVFNGYAEGERLMREARKAFGGPVIACGNLDKIKGEAYLESGVADLIAFGRAYIANPDLVARLEKDSPLNEPDPQTFYGGGEKGYTDYPVMDC